MASRGLLLLWNREGKGSDRGRVLSSPPSVRGIEEEEAVTFSGEGRKRERR